MLLEQSYNCIITHFHYGCAAMRAMEAPRGVVSVSAHAASMHVRSLQAVS